LLNNNHFSHKISSFHGRAAPEEGWIVGYGALIEAFALQIPLPDKLALISTKNRKYSTEQWSIFTPRYKPEESIYKQLVFALKYEGINLILFKKLFDVLGESNVKDIISQEPLGQYSRRIWFLYEWLLQSKISIPDLEIGNFISLLDEDLQYGTKEGIRHSRHRIINNLPGNKNFCPIIRKTPKLEAYIKKPLFAQNEVYLKGIRKAILQRASAFLLLNDSKASFTIEGESPKSKRAARWGQAIGQAGGNDLSHEEFARLQQMVIENSRFIEMGYRKRGGFIGERDQDTFSPLPSHISAKPGDIEVLIQGLIECNKLLLENEIDAVLAASVIAFGFVFIHPFVDGNGRIHRYLIHHVLAKKQFSRQGIIFPISASILNHIGDYQKVLESYSLPLLDFIEWHETKNHNIEVSNETIDYYRYFDATKQAEFLYDCVKDTVENLIPAEVNYLIKYEAFKSYIDNSIEMPDDMIALLMRFLEQNDGLLSKRAKNNEFSALTQDEISLIEKNYKRIMIDEE
jgi:hypothetical protein